MAHTVTEIPRLYVRSDWMPPLNMVNYNLQLRVNNYIKRVTHLFNKRQTKSNMLPYQRRILADFRTNKQHIVMSADKNLGPCVIERKQYILRALNDHLLKKDTYRNLTPLQAHQYVENIKQKLSNFIEYYSNKISPSDIKFLRKTMETTDSFPKFYITAKVHKTPLQTRPIVSISGSLLDGLGRWVDKVLQPYFKTIPSAIRNSIQLKDMLTELGPLPPNARIFTCDAISMYTNINTTHALAVIKQFLRRQNELSTMHERNAAIEALELIMKNNLVQFGDTYWLQLNGTAMGVSPSCVYATLYFASHEQRILLKYPELSFYKRYIDDIIGIWIPSFIHDEQRWISFQNDMNNYGSLRWEFSERTLTVNFLDLTLQITTCGKIISKIYEKPENLYLYLPSNSCHPFSNLKGLIHGMVYRTIRLTTTVRDQSTELQNLVRRLTTRGYNQDFLIKIINETYHRINQTRDINRQATNRDEICFFHTFYHPNDPKSSDLQRVFHEEMLSPKRMYKQLPDLFNHRKAKLRVKRMIIAYHRTPNLGNLLSPRVLKNEDGPRVSSYIG
jgi:hypothetical protein